MDVEQSFRSKQAGEREHTSMSSFVILQHGFCFGRRYLAEVVKSSSIKILFD